MSIRIALAAVATLAAIAQPALAEQSLSKRAAIAADASIDVSNVQGSVTVTAWDRSEVELTALLESDKDELEFEATEREVRIEVDRPEGKYRGDDGDAILSLKVPKGARLSVDTVSADIAVTGVRGEQTLESVSGTVETQTFDERVSLHSVSGDVTARGNGGKAQVRTENVSGTTAVAGIKGSYEGETVSGDINVSIAGAERLRLATVSGDASANAQLTSGAHVEMESVSGELTLTLKPPVNAEFDLESFSGDIEACFGPKARDKSKFSPGSELSFTQGNGGARVTVQTLSGEISICDR